MAATQTTEDMASGVSQGIPVMLCHTAGNREEVPTRTTSVISNMCIVQPSRKIRPIPPPLDLSKRGPLLDDTSSDDTFSDYIPFSASPRSPLSSNQKHLPFRKRAFSWTTFHDESSCHLLSPGPASASLQRSTYSAFMPTSPHINRLSVIKQESLDQSQDVFVEYLIPKMEIKEEPECDGDNSSNSSTGPGSYQMGPTVNYPPAQSPAFPTPVTPSPRSPMNFPPASKFFPQHFQPKTNLPPYSAWSASTLLSPAPSLHSSSQEELMQCRPWKYEESDMEDTSGRAEEVFQSEMTRDDYTPGEPQPGTSELCERLQRFDFVIPSPKSKEKRFCVSVSEEPTTAGVPPPPTAKRPMNGFMLFAQKYRLQLIQQFPGRDNRAISVMLGDAWKRLNPAEKELYTAEAHLRAEEYRRLYPDCWKRKRSKSTS